MWTRDLHVQPNARSVLARDVLVVPERETKLARVDPADGATMWVADVADVWGWTAVGSGCCVYLDQSASVQCLDLATGEPRWNRRLRHGAVFGHLLVTDDVTVVGGWRGYTDVRGLDLATGEERWRRPTRGRSLAAPLAGPWGLALAFPAERRLELVDPATGDVRSRTDLPRVGPVQDAQPLLARAGETLLVPGESAVFAVDPGDGRARAVLRHPRPLATPAVVAGARLTLLDDDHRLCVFDAATGAPLWALRVHSNTGEPPAVTHLDDGGLAYATEFGRLVTFAPDGEVRRAVTVGRRVTTPMTQTSLGGLVLGTSGALVSVAP